MERISGIKENICCKGRLVSLASPIVMGILNLTPDSFYDGDPKINESKVLKKVERMLNDGARIIDVGAYSSRPGAKDITEDEEYGRLWPYLEVLRKSFPETVFSVDTFRSGIARNVVEKFEIDMINDISGGELDGKMFETIADLSVPYVLMHMQGKPQTMQKQINYNHVLKDIIRFFSAKVEKLTSLGVKDIILDPGFGFGKTVDNNYELLSQLDSFRIFNLPILAGISRKSMVYKSLNISPTEALNGTTALHMIALMKGAKILRVHDVKEAKETIKLFSFMSEY